MYENRVYTIRNIHSMLDKLKGKKIVFTNGCFDLIHYGHICLLDYSRKLGDVLIVGLNSDASIRRLKGCMRPINNCKVRAEMLLALRPVDYVVIFDSNTPEGLIELIKPDILVKGSDYSINTIVGAEIVKKNGGKVVIFERVENYSTTSMLYKIVEKNVKI